MACASCEPDRTAAYSEDLRWRMVYQRIGMSRTYKEIAKSLNVDQSTVQRTVALFEETGDMHKRKYPPNAGTAKLSDIGTLIVLEVVISKPGIYLREVREEVRQTTGIDINEGTICRFLKESGFTRQKMKLAAQQRSELLRSQYILDMSVYQGHPEFFIFVDEMGSDRRDRMRKIAYNLKGRPPVVEKFLIRGDHVSAITTMTCDRILDFHTVIGGVTTENFDHFVTDALLPYLQPFNGINPCSIVVLNNARIHHAGDVLSLAEGAGALVHFLPPYSPDFNPIEEVFSKVKSILKENEDAWSDWNVETAVSAAFNCVTSKDCHAWVAHCGYQ